MKSTNNPIHFELQVKALFEIFLGYYNFFFLRLNISVVHLTFTGPCIVIYSYNESQ